MPHNSIKHINGPLSGKNMENQQAFLEKQQQIYDKFRRNESVTLEEGLRPGKNVNDRDGYLVVLRHNGAIAEGCYEVSKGINEIVPAMVYKPESVHTTLFMDGMQFRSPENRSKDNELVGKMEEALSCARDSGSFNIRYGSWLFNDNSVIVEGHEDIGQARIFHLAQSLYGGLVEALKREPKSSLWGSHITASRFTEEVDPGNKVNEMAEFVRRQKPLGTSEITAIDLAYVTVTKGNIDLETLERFKL